MENRGREAETGRENGRETEAEGAATAATEVEVEVAHLVAAVIIVVVKMIIIILDHTIRLDAGGISLMMMTTIMEVGEDTTGEEGEEIKGHAIGERTGLIRMQGCYGMDSNGRLDLMRSKNTPEITEELCEE